MNKRFISQEALKLIACVTMLLDHIGATILPSVTLRIIGRVSFPIYCFLLAEGIVHTRDPKRYGMRLALGAVLAEVPYELLFYGKLTFLHQSVMVTLLLGFLMAVWIRKGAHFLLPLSVCFFAAEVLGTDYGGFGVALVALFVLTADRPGKYLIQTVGMGLIMLMMGSVSVSVGIVQVPIQMFALLSMIPISFYSGEKVTDSPWVQRAFYLFYPAHLAVLLLIVRL